MYIKNSTEKNEKKKLIKNGYLLQIKSNFLINCLQQNHF